MRRVLLAITLLTLLPTSLTSQKPSEDRLPTAGELHCEPGDWLCRQQQRDLEKQRNRRRHTELKSDTDKLLELAQELKRSVDQSNEHTLSYGVVRKAEEIEKLAKGVKNKMKGW